jgi:hypothetical protein
MANRIIPSLRSALERLKHAGAVNGICLGWRRQVLVSLLPFENYRAEKLIHAVQDAREHYAQGGHDVQQFWFGYDGVFALVSFSGDASLVLLHSRAVEIDFLAKAASVFLNDCQLLIDAGLQPSEEELAQQQESPQMDDATADLLSRVLL